MNNDTTTAFPKLQARLLRRHAVTTLRLHEKLRLFGHFYSDAPDSPRRWHLDPSLSYRYQPELDEIGEVFEQHTGGPETGLGLEVWCDVGDRQAIEYNTLVAATGRLLQVHVIDENGLRLPYGDERRLIAIFREHLRFAPDHSLLREYGGRTAEQDRVSRLKADVRAYRDRGEFAEELPAWLRQIQQAEEKLDADLEVITERLVYDRTRCECRECCTRAIQ
jgi:hypothetical protein